MYTYPTTYQSACTVIFNALKGVGNFAQSSLFSTPAKSLEIKTRKVIENKDKFIGNTKKKTTNLFKMGSELFNIRIKVVENKYKIV